MPRLPMMWENRRAPGKSWRTVLFITVGATSGRFNRVRRTFNRRKSNGFGCGVDNRDPMISFLMRGVVTQACFENGWEGA